MLRCLLDLGCPITYSTHGSCDRGELFSAVLSRGAPMPAVEFLRANGCCVNWEDAWRQALKGKPNPSVLELVQREGEAAAVERSKRHWRGRQRKWRER